MKSNRLAYLGCMIIVVLSMLIPASVARAQDGSQCDFDEEISKGPQPSPPPPQAWPPYYVYKKLGKGDQRTASGCPNCLVQHSGLVSWIGEQRISDEVFAKNVFATMFPGSFNNPYFPMVFVFGECYGGGMIDDLQRAITLNPMSIVSASFYNQPALYPVAIIDGGTGQDFIWAWINGVQQPAVTAQLAAVTAARNDPWGWNARTVPGRTIKETRGAETPEYYSQNNGDTIPLASRQPGVSGFDRIILWAGQPNEVDDAQLSELLKKLTMPPLSFDKKNIQVLFASGNPANGQLVQTMKMLYGADQTHLKRADQKQLDIALKWAFPIPDPEHPRPRPQFFLFLAADHGCNNAFRPQSKTGDGGLPIEDGGDWGGGDDDYPPSQ